MRHGLERQTDNDERARMALERQRNLEETSPISQHQYNTATRTRPEVSSGPNDTMGAPGDECPDRQRPFLSTNNNARSKGGILITDILVGRLFNQLAECNTRLIITPCRRGNAIDFRMQEDMEDH